MTNNKFLLLIIAYILPNILLAKNPDKSFFLDSLQNKGIKTYFVFYEKLYGNIIYKDPCDKGIIENQYIVWLEDSKYNIQKINSCYLFPVIHYDFSSCIHYFLKNKTILKKEKILPEKHQKKTVWFKDYINTIDLYGDINDTEFTYKVNMNDFDKQYNMEYYKQNRKLKLYHWIECIRQILNEIESKKLFVPTKQIYNENDSLKLFFEETLQEIKKIRNNHLLPVE